MNSTYFLAEDKLVLLKLQMGQIFQYSFKNHIWYNVPEMKGIEKYSNLLTQITLEEANDYIKAVESMINHRRKAR